MQGQSQECEWRSYHAWRGPSERVVKPSGDGGPFFSGVETLGFESLMVDLGWSPSVKEVLTDSNAARAMASRRGLGKTRHIEVRRLWLQEAIEARSVQMGRVEGKENLADPLTKLKSFEEAMAKFVKVGVQ